MRYLGGKTKIARAIAAVVAPRGPWWEPFCGGLSVSVALSAYGPGAATDACAPLINMYQAVARGWVPPSTVTEDEYRAARALPDENPMKAFAGFCLSFGGKWFGGRARSRTTTRNFAAESSRSLLRDVDALRRAAVLVACLDFFDVRPRPDPTLYCDPPYAGTTGYGAVPSFDSARFWDRAREWASAGSRVFVSEYDAPAGLADIAWEREHHLYVSPTAYNRKRTVERLWCVKPAPACRTWSLPAPPVEASTPAH